MNARDTSTDHIFNAIRRMITEELPDLTLLFIVCEEGRQTSAFVSRKGEISAHPAAKKLFTRAEELLASSSKKTFGSILVEHTEKSFGGFFKKQHFLAACFINKHILAQFDDLELSCKAAAYTGAFEALHLYLQHKNHKTFQNMQSSPARAQTCARRIKLMADCFAAMIIESTGHKNATQLITKKYCENTLTALTNSYPENHPLPMAADGLYVTYKDLKSDAPHKSSLIQHTYYMTTEIGHTYDDIALEQWVRFSMGAQDMAWAGHSKNDILSAAVYGSDSPYIRSNAHICAENLNITPVPLKNNDIYNPFADEEVNERAHIRACKAAFVKVLERVNQNGDSYIFLKEAYTQTKRLFAFCPLGWCAPALIEAENAYRLFKETPSAEEDMVHNAFEAAFVQIRWKDLKALNRRFIALSRTGLTIGPHEALSLIGDNETYAPCKNAFELLKEKAAR